MRRLTPWESEARLIGLYMATGLLLGDHAQSVLLVGPPGQGKTAMIRRFRLLPTARLFSDLTSDGVRRAITDNTKVRHMLMPEFERLFSRDRAVSSQTANLLCNLMTGDAGEEGIGQKTYNFEGRQVGVIGAMTADMYRARTEQLKETGLLSRFTVLGIDRSQAERARIVTNILNHRMDDLTPIQWPQLLTPRTVTDTAHISRHISQWLKRDTAMPADERFVSRLLVLLKACALLAGRDVVTPFDLEVLQRFTPYFVGKKDVVLDWPTL